MPWACAYSVRFTGQAFYLEHEFAIQSTLNGYTARTSYHLAHGLLDYAEYLIDRGDAEVAVDEAPRHRDGPARRRSTEPASSSRETTDTGLTGHYGVVYPEMTGLMGQARRD